MTCRGGIPSCSATIAADSRLSPVMRWICPTPASRREERASTASGRTTSATPISPTTRLPPGAPA